MNHNMIKLVTKQWYETEDGKQFDTQAGAEAHERVVTVAKVLMELDVDWEDSTTMEQAEVIVKAGYEFKPIDPQAQ